MDLRFFLRVPGFAYRKISLQHSYTSMATYINELRLLDPTCSSLSHWLSRFPTGCRLCSVFLHNKSGLHGSEAVPWVSICYCDGRISALAVFRDPHIGESHVAIAAISDSLRVSRRSRFVRCCQWTTISLYRSYP